MNKCFLVGRLGRDPEIINTRSGNPMTKFSVATTERIKKNDTYEDKTTWHDIIVFGWQAEASSKRLKKGSNVVIEGKIDKDEYTNKEGQKIRNVNIIANKVIMV